MFILDYMSDENKLQFCINLIKQLNKSSFYGILRLFITFFIELGIYE